jgi:hypothetical protein
MKLISISGTVILATLLMFTSISCEKEVRNETSEESFSSSAESARPLAESQLLKSVRQATSRYNSTTQAIAAGYVPDDHCVAVPNLGGMGYHWANPTLVDPVFDPLKPEVMLYATGPGGNLRLVAVEYVVINMGQPRPSFDGHLFDINGAPVPVPHWTLHVWVHEQNPSGIFVPFNPNITCP